GGPTMDSGTNELPRWDLDTLGRGLDSDAFEQRYQTIVSTVDAIEQLFDRHMITVETVGPIDATIAHAFDEIVEHLGPALDDVGTLGNYVYMHVAVNNTNELAQQR